MNEGDAIITLTGKIFKAASEDGVYFWKRGDEWLYVGATGNLIGRLAYHNIIGRVEPVLEDDVIGLIPTEPFSSISLESRLVEQHRPKYNPLRPPVGTRNSIATCLACRTTFSQKRSHQVYCSNPCRQGRRRVALISS